VTPRKPFSVSQVRAQDIIPDLPVLHEYDMPPPRIDIFICAAGFEPRVVAAPQRLLDDGRHVANAVLIGKYRTNEADNLGRFEELKPLLNRLSETMALEFDAEDPVQTGRTISSTFTGLPDSDIAFVTFDISGASSTLILSVFAALVSQTRKIDLTILYSTAKTYDQGQAKEAEELILSPDHAREQGVSKVSHNELCAGLHHDHLPTMVIALPSMYPERLESCLGHLNVGPMTGSHDNLFWILPSTDAVEHKWRQQAARESVEALIHKYQGHDSTVPPAGLLDENQIATCDVSSYQQCLSLIIGKTDEYQGRNISVVHMGTKLQAVGVALAVAARQEVAVVTARPAGFNAKTYSDGIGTLHTLHFSDLKASVSLVSSIGCLEVGVQRC
jgi:hypothetical protein